MLRKSILTVCAVCVLLIGVFVSCANLADNNSKEKSYYKIYKNFDELNSRSADSVIDGEPIVGVLLKYTSEGAYSDVVYSRDTTSFSIYCLFDAPGINEDKMKFNYVLYVPEGIRNEFIEGGGAHPNSGDPFWWYMKTYMNSSMSVIHNDWASTIKILCDNAECPQADSADVAGWNK